MRRKKNQVGEGKKIALLFFSKLLYWFIKFQEEEYLLAPHKDAHVKQKLVSAPVVCKTKSCN